MTRVLILVGVALLSGLTLGYYANADWFAGTIEIDQTGARLAVAPDQATFGRLIVVLSQMIQQTMPCQEQPSTLIADPPTRPMLPFIFCNCTCPRPGIIEIGMCGHQTDQGCHCP